MKAERAGQDDEGASSRRWQEEAAKRLRSMKVAGRPVFPYREGEAGGHSVDQPIELGSIELATVESLVASLPISMRGRTKQNTLGRRARNVAIAALGFDLAIHAPWIPPSSASAARVRELLESSLPNQIKGKAPKEVERIIRWARAPATGPDWFETFRASVERHLWKSPSVRDPSTLAALASAMIPLIYSRPSLGHGRGVQEIHIGIVDVEDEPLQQYFVRYTNVISACAKMLGRDIRFVCDVVERQHQQEKFLSPNTGYDIVMVSDLLVPEFMKSDVADDGFAPMRMSANPMCAIVSPACAAMLEEEGKGSISASDLISIARGFRGSSKNGGLVLPGNQPHRLSALITQLATAGGYTFDENLEVYPDEAHEVYRSIIPYLSKPATDVSNVNAVESVVSGEKDVTFAWLSTGLRAIMKSPNPETRVRMVPILNGGFAGDWHLAVRKSSRPRPLVRLIARMLAEPIDEQLLLGIGRPTSQIPDNPRLWTVYHERLAASGGAEVCASSRRIESWNIGYAQYVDIGRRSG